jgi:hypothetical protein
VDERRTDRRAFLKQMTALAAAVAGARPAVAGEAQGRSGMKTSYDPMKG